jgi:hypothetical protein
VHTYILDVRGGRGVQEDWPQMNADERK